MLPSNPIPQVCDYGSAALYRELPNEEQIRSGVVPLDSLPAAWWNCMWFATNQAVNCARYAAGALIDEINTVLTQAGVCVCDTCVDQLYQAIEKIRTTVGNANVAGSVKSSSCPGEVSINAQGIMTANCVGNAAALTTSARTLTGAINELKTTYDCCISDLESATTALGTNKAPVNHVSAQTTYGVGNATCYGHVKLSDTYNSCVGGASDAVAASQKALYDMYQAITSAGYVCLGNTAGCALGTASAGSATTAARSDHVHPMPTCIACAGCSRCAQSLYINGVTWESDWTWFDPGTNPAYVWGSDDGVNMRVFPPSRFAVASAASATSSDTARYATCAEYTKIQCVGYGSSWWYIPQIGQPTYIWGTNTGVDMFIWDPTAFSVSYSNTSGAACNANCLNGYLGSWYATGNTYALRDVNGNINAGYYNTGASAEDFMAYDAGSGAWTAFIDASGWIRKAHPSTTYAGFAQKMNYAIPQGSAASNVVYMSGTTLTNNTAEPILFFGRWAGAAVQYLPAYGSIGVATATPSDVGFIRIR